MKAQADKVLKEAVSRGDVPGVAAAATDAKGTTYEGGFGKRVLGEPADMTPDTVVWIASMTKAITGAAAMQLVERGKLALDAPAKAVVPAAGRGRRARRLRRQRQAQDAQAQARHHAPPPADPYRGLRLRHLEPARSASTWRRWRCRASSAARTRRSTTPLLFDPGERWFYGINIDWAGKMVEAASGKKLGQYMRDNILGPLGMDSTGFTITDSMRKRLAKIHHRGADGALQPDTALELPQEPEFEMGGGGLYSTAGDYLKFVRMMLNQGKSDHGEAVLKPATVAEMSKERHGQLQGLPAQDRGAALLQRCRVLPRHGQAVGPDAS